MMRVESLDPASLSICEDRSCQASDALVDGFDPVDDWPCAASSVLRVAGDSCEPALSGAELVEAEAGFAISNGSTALKPEDFAEDAPDEDPLDEVSALTASQRGSGSAQGKQHGRTLTMAASSGRVTTPIDQQTPCHAEKPSKIGVFHDQDSIRHPRQLMPQRQNFPPPIAAVRPAFARMLCAC